MPTTGGSPSSIRIGSGRRRIDLEQLRIAHPGLDVLEIDRHAVFGEHQPDEPRGGIEPVLQKPWHIRSFSWLSCWPCKLGEPRQIRLEAARRTAGVPLSRRSDERRSRSFCAADPRRSSKGLPNSCRSRRPATCCWSEHFLGFNSPGRVFEVLIQLGAILAIVVVYFQRLLGDCRRRHCRQARGLALHPRGAARLAPGRPRRGAAARFHQGCIYESPIDHLRHADRRRHRPALCRPAAADAEIHRHLRLSAAALPLYRAVPDAGAGARRVALRRHHRRLAAARHRQALGRRIHLLHRPADHGRGLRLRSLQEPRCSSRSELGLDIAVGFAAAFVVAFVRRALPARFRRRATASRPSPTGASSSAPSGSGACCCSSSRAVAGWAVRFRPSGGRTGRSCGSATDSSAAPRPSASA